MKQSLLFALILAGCCSGHASAQAESSNDARKLTGDEIISRHLDAAGGKEALSKFTSRVAIGTVKKENEPDGEMVIMSEAPNLVSAYYGFRDLEFRMIFDGKKAFLRPVFPRQAARIADKYLEMMASGLMFNNMSVYNLLTKSEPGTLKFEAKGSKKVQGRPAHVVEVKYTKGSSMKLYLDAETFMWVRTDYGRTSLSKEMGAFTNDVVNQAGNEVTIDFYIETSDFRNVDGVKLPFKIEQVMTSPILRQKSVGTIVGTIREYKHNIPIDPRMFQ